jgi:uncharacterized membrane protein (UPF0127 family)
LAKALKGFMKKALSFLVGLGLLIVAGGCAGAEPEAADPAAKSVDAVDFGPPQPLQILHGDTVIKMTVELADDPVERAQGLMFRTEMAESHGMLFDFESKRIVRMWMKNTLIPLDMIFLDEDGKVVSIARNARPRSLRTISSGVPVVSVLEINGGLARKWNLKRGDKVVHSLFGTPDIENGDSAALDAMVEQQSGD